MHNPFLRLSTYEGQEIIVNVNQIVCMKKCSNHPDKPGAPELLTEVKLSVGDVIYVSNTVEELFSRIEDI